MYARKVNQKLSFTDKQYWEDKFTSRCGTNCVRKIIPNSMVALKRANLVPPDPFPWDSIELFSYSEQVN